MRCSTRRNSIAFLRSAYSRARHYSSEDVPALAVCRELGFVEVPHASLPDKIFKDCRTCPLFNKCDETAMVYAGATADIGADDEVVERPVLRMLS